MLPTYTTGEPRDVANRTEVLKRGNYAAISATHHFIPVRTETLGVFSAEAKDLLLEVGHRVIEESGLYDYLLQSFIAVQQGMLQWC